MSAHFLFMSSKHKNHKSKHCLIGMFPIVCVANQHIERKRKQTTNTRTLYMLVLCWKYVQMLFSIQCCFMQHNAWKSSLLQSVLKMPPLIPNACFQPLGNAIFDCVANGCEIKLCMSTDDCCPELCEILRFFRCCCICPN